MVDDGHSKDTLDFEEEKGEIEDGETELKDESSDDTLDSKEEEGETDRDEKPEKKVVQENYRLRQEKNLLVKELENLKGKIDVIAQQSSSPPPRSDEEILKFYMNQEYQIEPGADPAILYQRAVRTMTQERNYANIFIRKDHEMSILKQTIDEVKKIVLDSKPEQLKYKEIQKDHPELDNMSKEEAVVFLSDQLRKKNEQKKAKEDVKDMKKKASVVVKSAGDQKTSPSMPEWFIENCKDFGLDPTPERFKKLHGGK